MANSQSSTTSTLVIAIALVAAYFVAGRLGLLLAIPPGYASAIGPAAGIALAAVYLWGWRVWPGILVGSFFVNIPVETDVLDFGASLGVLAVAVVIGCGAAIQAVAGGAMLRRVLTPQNDLESLRDVAIFFAIGGPLSCVIATTIGNTALFAAGTVEAPGITTSWLTWWTGDVLGVFVAAPLVLIAFAKPREMWRGRTLGVALPLVVVLVVATTLLVLTTNWEKRRIQLEFERRVAGVAQSVRLGLDSYSESLGSIERLYASSVSVSRSEFRTFVERALKRRPGIQALEWIPRVPASERARAEAGARADGLAGFVFRERSPQGKMIEATVRDDYYPVYFVEPRAGNEAAVGFDLGSNSTRRAALDQARDTGEQVATARITLVQETGRQFGFLIFEPIYKAGSKPSTCGAAICLVLPLASSAWATCSPRCYPGSAPNTSISG